MSRSFHITVKNFRGLTRNEQDEQLNDPSSDLRIWAKKSNLKGTKTIEPMTNTKIPKIIYFFI